MRARSHLGQGTGTSGGSPSGPTQDTLFSLPHKLQEPHLTLYSPLLWSGGKRPRDHGDLILGKRIHSGPLKEATRALVLPEPTPGVSHHSTRWVLPELSQTNWARNLRASKEGSLSFHQPHLLERSC